MSCHFLSFLVIFLDVLSLGLVIDDLSSIDVMPTVMACWLTLGD
jgi:hypothetical protein